MEIHSIKGVNLHTFKEPLELFSLFETKPEKPVQIVTVNAIIFTKSVSNPFLKNILNTSISFPESAGMKLLLKKYGIQGATLRGVEFVKNIIEFSIKKNLSIFFLGGRPSTSKKLVNIFKDKLKMAAHHGYFTDEKKVIDMINEFEPYFLLAGMGFPRQEIFIYKNRDRINASFAVGCGGSFDVITGSIDEAPEFFIKTNTEFLYRIIKQPWRLKNIPQLIRFLYILTR